MPCYDDRDSPANVAAEAVTRARKEFRHNSDVAQMLCSLIKALEAYGVTSLIDRPTAQWWEEHKKRDEAR